MFLLYLGSVLYLAAHSAAESQLCKQLVAHDNCGLLPDDQRCGIASLYDDTSRIIGGRDAKRNDFPWVACLKYYETDPNCFCAGVLISKLHILTAAHCVDSKLPKRDFWVFLGEHDLRTDPDCDQDTGKCAAPVQKYQPKLILVHNMHQDYHHFDIALVKLKRNVDVNRYVQPICLPFVDLWSTDGLSVTAVGWGRNVRNPQSPIQPILQVIEFGVMRHSDCKNKPDREPITERQICVKINGTHRTTKADSGGPLMALNITATGANKYDLIGLTSYFNRGDPPKVVYTRVTSYLNWILRNM